jgi:hypothetical protein
MGTPAAKISSDRQFAKVPAAFPHSWIFRATRLSHDGITMSEQDKAELRLSLARLRQDHADFDAAIDAMMKTGCDPLQIQRMKKKKLTIKDQLTRLEDQVIPDIIA